MSHTFPEDIRERAFRFTYSRRELAAKNAISLKESRESKYWPRVAAAKSLGKKELREWLLQESDEFVAMLNVELSFER